MMRNILAFGLAACVAVVGTASASEVTFLPFEKVAARVKFVLHVRIKDARHSRTLMTLPDGKDGPPLAEHVQYTGDVVGVVYGPWPATARTASVTFTLQLPIAYDKTGKVIATGSPIEPGSGVELSLQEGSEYLLCLERFDPQAPAPLLRAEPLDSRRQILGALGKLAAATGPATRPRGAVAEPEIRVIGVPGAPGYNKPKEGFELVLEMPKARMGLKDPVPVKLTARNVGGKTIVLEGILPKRSAAGPPGLLIEGPNGLRVGVDGWDAGVLVPAVNNDEPIVLRPGEAVVLIDGDLGGFPCHVMDRERASSRPVKALGPLLGEGEYTIQGCFLTGPQNYSTQTPPARFRIGAPATTRPDARRRLRDAVSMADALAALYQGEDIERVGRLIDDSGAGPQSPPRSLRPTQ